MNDPATSSPVNRVRPRPARTLATIERNGRILLPVNEFARNLGGRANRGPACGPRAGLTPDRIRR